MLDTIIKLLSSYPLWAKLCLAASVSFAFVVLLAAPRNGTDRSANADPSRSNAPSNPAVSANSGRISLTIIGVRLFPDDPNADVQVVAVVNGTSYVYPSVDGVVWLKVGPDMARKIIDLPEAPIYQIKFQMRIRGGAKLASNEEQNLHADRSERAESQLVNNITKLPFYEDYKLYEVNGDTRSAAVRAIVSYSITESP